MILPPGTHCSRLSRNGSHMSTHTASIPFRWRLVKSVRKIHPASPSCAPSQTTTAPQFPDCTPPSETCPSCPCTVHRELSVGVRNSEVVLLRYPVMPVTNRLGG